MCFLISEIEMWRLAWVWELLHSSPGGVARQCVRYACAAKLEEENCRRDNETVRKTDEAEMITGTRKVWSNSQQEQQPENNIITCWSLNHM